MDMSLLLLIIGVLVIIYLIFKLIKKIVFAVITVFVFIFLIIGGVFGLVYMDYKYLTEQKDYDVNLIYSENGDYTLGATLQIKNQTPDLETIKGITSSGLSGIDPEEIDSDSGVFMVVVDNELFKSLITKDEYTLQELADFDSTGYDLSLTKNEVISIIDSEDGIDKFTQIMLDKNKITGIERDIAEKLIKDQIKAELDKSNMNLKQALFLLVMSQSAEDEKNIVTLVEGFKNESLQIYPERFTFKLVRMLPVDTLKSFFEDSVPAE